MTVLLAYHALTGGVSGYLTKEFDSDKIVDAVVKVRTCPPGQPGGWSMKSNNGPEERRRF
ncbi:hypothetical protein DIJ64_04320 [Mycobacterium leprae]|uniref:Uncharacterized protein n=1 Tax=Mycobacterium leprae TaxID=1769 RepID=A0AAD0KTB4_MYCLR|nr:hypothetical protein [Mycobacterium leprae]AWV47583.1 hypothetical protein DIJ64_04320 [Mycobacterium leprae]OAR21794.1 hypothetical protein A8144_00990 [Mycobacterium leprae 3125609]OAX72336.1 hypothetical protein A3216_01070 [Mycobacterium leprae 7935681]